MKTIIISILTVITVSAQEANTLDTYRQTYERKQQTILSQYAKDIDSAIANSKKKGDLENVLILQVEQKRFEAEKTIPAPKDAKSSYRLATEVYHQSMVTLLGQYATALDTVIKKETSADRIEAAKVVKTEKDKIDFILADMKAKLPSSTVDAHGETPSQKIVQNDKINKIDQTKHDRYFKLGHPKLTLFPQIKTFHADGTISGERGTLEANMQKWKEKRPSGDISVLDVTGKEWLLFKKGKNSDDKMLYKSPDWYLIEQENKD
ncbi:MAG: hypothetical protein PHI84_20230 [Kiritimatiellae bacterium]|nr:hypothetical protein [Kiritimatiellia bacterium]